MRTLVLSLLLATLLAAPFPGAASSSRLVHYYVGADTPYGASPVACYEVSDGDPTLLYTFAFGCGWHDVEPGNVTVIVLGHLDGAVDFRYSAYRTIGDGISPTIEVCVQGEAYGAARFYVPAGCDTVAFEVLTTSAAGFATLSQRA